MRERLQEKEGKRDWKESWAIEGKERRLGVERVKTFKEL